jgi:hypothetical protein
MVIARYLWDVDFQHQKRDDDRQDAIGKRLHASGFRGTSAEQSRSPGHANATGREIFYFTSAATWK